MKQFEILDGKALVVELPEDVTKVDYVYKNKMTHLIEEDGESSFLSVDGEWHVIGMLSELTDEQAAGLVGSEETQGAWPYADVFLKNYQSGSFDLNSSLESIKSAILAEGYFLDEPPFKQGKYPISSESFVKAGFGENDLVDQRYDDHIHNQAQSRVLSRKHCLILRRMEE